jgi:hypothetical protein
LSQYDPYNPPASDVAPQQGWGQDAPLGPSPSVQATMNQMTDRMQTVIDAAERAADAIRHDAEEQARRHLSEAQRKADRMTAERVRLISELTDDLIRHAATVRDHSEQMVRALEDAISSVTGKLGEPAFTDPFPLDEGQPASYEAPPLPLSSQMPALPSTPAPAPQPEPARGYESSWPQEPAQPVPAPAPEPQAAPPPAAPAQPAAPASPPPAAGPPSQEALLHATRLAVAGNDRETIARALRDEHGIADPDPVVDRVLGEG